ncbi:MAG: zinc ABC transporter substrate-binding protein [Oscillospiraceae bacterium]|nr:zinc ABC transporter substrate-binding protein [Oscillospiraceae bacterium]
MKQRLIALLAAMLLLLTSCGSGVTTKEDSFRIACTTYPVYLLANTIAEGVDGAEVTLVIDQQVSCLHDYTLTMKDMKAVESADVIAINGAGLEDFLSQVLEGRVVIDCSEGIELLCTEEHHHEEEEEHDHDHDHDHDHGEYDPHLWMSPTCYAQMARNLADALAEADPEHSEQYLTQGEACALKLEAFYDELLETEMAQELAGESIITFHDGFGYFANAFDLTIAAAIEEEEGAEASAHDLKETIEIVTAQHLPAVFTERDGSEKAANTISRECGVTVNSLCMLMSGSPGDNINAYMSEIEYNLKTIWEAYHEA